jgi:hypothetical protein
MAPSSLNKYGSEVSWSVPVSMMKGPELCSVPLVSVLDATIALASPCVLEKPVRKSTARSPANAVSSFKQDFLFMNLESPFLIQWNMVSDYLSLV